MQALFNRSFIHVHNRILFGRCCMLTLLSSLVGKRAAFSKRFTEEFMLPGFLAHCIAEFYVLNVIKAEVIPMQD